MLTNSFLLVLGLVQFSSSRILAGLSLLIYLLNVVSLYPELRVWDLDFLFGIGCSKCIIQFTLCTNILSIKGQLRFCSVCYADNFLSSLISRRCSCTEMEMSSFWWHFLHWLLCTGRCPWWRHQMKTFSALLAICAGNSPVPGVFPTQRPVTRSFDVLFDLRLNKRLSKPSWGWWFETPSRPLWRHRNAKWQCPVQPVTKMSSKLCYFIKITFPFCCMITFGDKIVLFYQNHISVLLYNNLRCQYCIILSESHFRLLYNNLRCQNCIILSKSHFRFAV